MTDRYQIISTLSSGGNGSVHRAWDKSKNQDVALKRLHAGPEQALLLEREARVLYGLRHPSIVTVTDFGKDEEGAWMVMEWVKGKSLEEIVSKNGPLPMEEFDVLVRQTLAALQAAHEAGVMHRDVKPENLLMPWDAKKGLQVKLIDFGLAGEASGQPAKAEGSVHYMAPELFGNAIVDLRADLYALGAVFYFALTGRPPFEGETGPQVIVAHLYHRCKPLAELRPDLPDALCAWVDRLMSMQPADRPTSAAEALEMYDMTHAEPAVALAVAEDEEPVLLAPVLEDEEEVEAAPQPAAEDEPAYAPAPGQELEQEPEPEPPAEEPARTEPVSYLEEPAPAAVPAPERAPAPAARAETARRMPAHRPAADKAAAPKTKGGGFRLTLGFIVIACLVILVAQFGVISYFKYAGRETKLRRLEQMAAEARPTGSDLDIAMLLEYLSDTKERPRAGDVLARVQGGSYIDSMILEHLPKVAQFPACTELVKIIGHRGLTSAFDEVIKLTSDPRVEVRQAAWTALGNITTPNRVPDLLQGVKPRGPSDRKVLVEALVALVSQAQDSTAMTRPILQGWQAAKENPDLRSLLLDVLSQVGGPETLPIVAEAVADPSTEVRQAAIYALAQYPTHDLLPVLTARLPEETDTTCRMYLILAAIELIPKPGPSSQEVLARHAQSLYANAKDGDERRRALEAVSAVVAPATARFYETFAQEGDPKLRAEARNLGQAFRFRLEKIVPVTPQEPSTLLAEKAMYTLGGNVVLDEGALIGWRAVQDGASWLVQLPDAGEYEIAVYQSHPEEECGTYEVLLASTTLLTAVVKTESAADFKGFVVGNATVPEAGTYRLLVRPKKIPEGQELFRIQKLVVKRVK